MKPRFRVIYSKALMCYGVKVPTINKKRRDYIFQNGDIWTVKNGVIDELLSWHTLKDIKYNPLELIHKKLVTI